MRVRAILNPRAGLAARRAQRAVEDGRRFWPDLELKLTTAPGDARQWARESAERGDDLVIAVGGDGTANEAAWGLLGSKTALGLVPVGSGNGLARSLGIPLEAGRAVNSLGANVRRRMDVGFANERPFLNVAGAGFDAAIAVAFHERGKEGGRRGILTYVRLGLRQAWRYQSQTWSVTADGQRFEGRAMIVAILNGRQYGGGARMAPGARLDDGLLEVVVIEDAPRLEVLLNAPRLFLGNIGGYRRYRHFSASRVTLTSDRAFDHYRDGEPELGSERLDVRVERGALEVLVAPAIANDPAGPFERASS
jgi:YegS/Rv2252/BmrU family lipid kinase